MIRYRRLSLLIAYLIVCSQALAVEPLAFPLDEPPLAAKLANIDPEWNIHLQISDKLCVVAAKDLAYWGRYREAELGPQILLTDGSVIRADVLSLDDKQLVLGDATGLGRGQWDESTLPRAAVSAIAFQPPAGAAARDKFWESLFRDSPHEDRLFLQGGESLGGTLLAAPVSGRFVPEGAKAGGEVFQVAQAGVAEPLSIPASKVLAYRAPLAVSGRSSAGLAWLGLADGSLIHAQSIAVKAEGVSISLAGGGTLHTTLAGRANADQKIWDEIEYIEPVTQRVAWLAQAKPLGYKQIPFLTTLRPLGVDRNVLGSRLRAGSAMYLHGLGMPSTSRVAYSTAGYRQFEAELAIDDAAGLRGSVVFRVLLETAEGQWAAAYQSPTIRGGDPPLPIAVDLKGASRMALIVDFAERGDECDWADWLQARLVK